MISKGVGNMAVRIFTSVIGLVVFFAILIAGAIPFNIAVIAVTFVMLYEFYKSSKTKGIVTLVGYITSIIILIGTAIGEKALYISILMSVCLYLVFMLYSHGKINYTRIFSSAFGTMFISLFMGTLVLMRYDYGVFGVLLAFICSWLTDTGAYFTGRFFGRHKLIPSVSPKKTVEGAVGGIVTATVSVVIYLAVARGIGMEHSDKIGFFAIAVIGAVTSVFSQIGDLVASAIKRDCDIKDFGNLLPGHGGLLDRFDSVLFVSPFVLFLLLLFV